LPVRCYLGFGAKGVWISVGIVWAISGGTAWLRYYFHFHRKFFHREIPSLAHTALMAKKY
jgi:Na+-driven multidrug efflux pump